MPDIKKFKSISVNKDTHDRLMGMSQDRFEVPVSVQTCINFMLNREDERWNHAAKRAGQIATVQNMKPIKLSSWEL